MIRKVTLNTNIHFQTLSLTNLMTIIDKNDPKIVKHTLKILQHLLQDFQRVFDHFVDTRHHRVNFFLVKIGKNYPKVSNIKSIGTTSLWALFQWLFLDFEQVFVQSQKTFNCSKLAIETLEKVVKYVQSSQ